MVNFEDDERASFDEGMKKPIHKFLNFSLFSRFEWGRKAAWRPKSARWWTLKILLENSTHKISVPYLFGFVTENLILYK